MLYHSQCVADTALAASVSKSRAISTSCRLQMTSFLGRYMVLTSLSGSTYSLYDIDVGEKNDDTMSYRRASVSLFLKEPRR